MDTINPVKMTIVLNCARSSKEEITLTLDAMTGSITEGIIVNIVLLSVSNNYLAFLIEKKVPNVSVISSKSVSLEALKKATSIDDDYLMILTAGSIPSSGVFTRLLKDKRKGCLVSLYVSKEGSYNYICNRSLRRKEVIIGQHYSNQWTAPNGFILSVALLNSCQIEINDITYNKWQSLFSEALLRSRIFCVTGGSIKSIGYHEDRTTLSPRLYDKQWYMELNSYWGKLLELCRRKGMSLPKYHCYNYLYQLQWRAAHNKTVSNKCVLWQDEVNKFWDESAKIIREIPTEIINHRPGTKVFKHLGRGFRLFLIKLRNGTNSFTYKELTNDVVLYSDKVDIWSLADSTLSIDLMDVTDDILEIAGIVPYPVYDNEFQLYAKINNNKYYARHVGRLSHQAIMGIEIFRDFDFSIRIPIKLIKSGLLKFYMQYKNTQVPIRIKYRKPLSKLYNYISYWAVDNKIFQPLTRYSIRIESYTKYKHLRKEVKYCLYLYRKLNQKSAVKLRIIYNLTRPFMSRKKIWLFWDKLYKSGDNGEYLFRYALNKRDGIKKYYILQESSPDANRFKDEGIPFVKFGSIYNKLLLLNADVTFSTHIVAPRYNGFAGGYDRFFRDLFNYKNVCIQHGLSVQNISEYQNRIIDSTSYYYVASPIETDNLSYNEYDYEKSSIIHTGLARYDGLISRPSKQILIAPTWRTYLAKPGVHGSSRKKSDEFSNSIYFYLYKSLISNNLFLEEARKYGYHILMYLHPCLGSQIDDFPEIPNVSVMSSNAGISYTDVLKNSSLLVTDYSGIQFDFAYMYKPIVYFHPPELPPSYDEGSYKYQSMALGDICTSLDNLVDNICHYIQNGCKVKREYKCRMDNFFYHHDHNNCKRIYEHVISNIPKRP